MRVLEMAADGSELQMWVSAATDLDDCVVWSPKSLHQEICDNVGFPQPVSNIFCTNYELYTKCTQENWMHYIKWQADCLHYMIEKHGVEVIFSHLHNDDAEKHNFLDFCGEPSRANEDCSAEQYEDVLANVSRQNDYYIGRFLPLLDQGWSILLVSDHGLSVPPVTLAVDYNPISIVGINTTVMVDWGFTALQKDENGDYIGEIDWPNTKAIMTRLNNIYINLKGRWPDGIVEPEDKWELEEQIMGKLYELKSPRDGKRYVSLALRNKDAVHVGLGGDECGDIIFFENDDHTGQHGGGLSTTLGIHSSISPIFVAAGQGIKKGETITRYVRTIDIAPTVAALGGVRMPKQCEGAPAYQIFTEEY
jgi:predicted AlkP superfamily phosphohydrolase/phosphomutase